jgi:hypothetical protein
MMHGGDFSSDLMLMLDPQGGDDPVIHLTLDDVGDCNRDGMSAVVGYAAYRERWQDFNYAWRKTLADFGLEFIHTTEYLYKYLRVGDHPPTDAEIFKTLDPWIDIIHVHLLNPNLRPNSPPPGFGVSMLVRCDAYNELSPNEKKFVREPWITAFELAVGMACKVVKDDLSKENGMAVQMDESQNASHLYESYQALKAENDTVRKFLGAICFCDDKLHWPVQAADLLAHLTLRAWRNYGIAAPWPEAFRRLVSPDGKPTVVSHVFGVAGLKKLAAMRMNLKNRMAIPDVGDIPSE